MGGFLGGLGNSTILFFLIIFLLLFDGGSGGPFGSSEILFFLILFLLLFDGGGIKRHIPL